MANEIVGFDLFDTFSFIIPGSLALILTYPFVSPRVIMAINDLNSSILLILFLVLSFIIGHIFFGLSNKIPKIKDEFTELEDKRDKSRLEHQNKFFESAPNFLGLSEEYEGKELYYTSKSHLFCEAKGSGRVAKFHTLHDLFHSTTLISFISGIVYITYGYFYDGLIGISGGILLILSVSSFYSARYFQHCHVVTLITEFYTNFLRENEIQQCECFDNDGDNPS
ncbi:hypothetical protein [Natrinema sp. HArc-T2]|uniref:hypothetical protein n=1 Tax=Natrinema sp. HArc-T2 TaxID=3242701 RepID=UPI00359DEAC2